MSLKNNQTIAGIIFILIWIGLILLLSDKIQPDLRSDGGYEPAKGVGHPLYQDY